MLKGLAEQTVTAGVTWQQVRDAKGGYLNGNKFDWGSWSLLGTRDQTIAAASYAVFGTIDNDGKVATEVAIDITYASGATLGANVQIERDIDGTNFESASSLPWTVPLPFAANTTKRVITVPTMVNQFRVRVVNLSPATHALTNATVRYRQCVHATV